MRGRRVGSAPLFQSIRFHRALKSFQATWNAIEVLPVPVASDEKVRGILAEIRCLPSFGGPLMKV